MPRARSVSNSGIVRPLRPRFHHVVIAAPPTCDGHQFEPSAPPSSPGKPRPFPGPQKASQFLSVSEACRGLRTEFPPFSRVLRLNSPAIAEAQAAGAKSLRQIAAALNGRGIATARGGKWEAATVANVLKRVAV